MEDPNKHIEHNEFFSKVEIPYTETKDDIWNKLSEQIEVKEKGRNVEMKAKRKSVIWYSAAAVIILLISITGFMRFYSLELICPKGQHLAVNLPDGSAVQLNAQTSISYHPYWWKFSRELELDGEAYFDVEKGNAFKVVSKYGTTKVLGTTFNIFSREKTYKVHCFTGKVLIKSKKGEEDILNPGFSGEISKEGITKVKKEESIENATAWIENNFIFTGVPLKDVFKELERQFDIKIELSSNISDNYTGNFKRGSSPEEIIDLICKPFALSYNKLSTNKYIVYK